MLLAYFGSVSLNILNVLFTSYCCNCYGIVLCNIRSNGFKKLHILWRKAIRRILRLPRRTHNVLFPVIFGKYDFDVAVITRIMKFYMSLLASSNNLISNLAIRCQYQSLSNTGKNVSFFYKNMALLTLQKHLCQYCLKTL